MGCAAGSGSAGRSERCGISMRCKPAVDRRMANRLGPLGLEIKREDGEENSS